MRVCPRDYTGGCWGEREGDLLRVREHVYDASRKEEGTKLWLCGGRRRREEEEEEGKRRTMEGKEHNSGGGAKRYEIGCKAEKESAANIENE